MDRLNLEKQLAIAKKIKEAQKDIRQKSLLLKLGQMSETNITSERLKPITEPLKRIVDLQEKKFSQKREEKEKAFNEIKNALTAARVQKEKLSKILSSPKQYKSDIEARRQKVEQIFNSPRRISFSRRDSSSEVPNTPEWDNAFDTMGPFQENYYNIAGSSNQQKEIDDSTLKTSDPTSSNEVKDIFEEPPPNQEEPAKHISTQKQTTEIVNTPSRQQEEAVSSVLKDLKSNKSIDSLNYYLNLLHNKDERIDQTSSGVKLRKTKSADKFDYEFNRVPIRFVKNKSNEYFLQLKNGRKFLMTEGLTELLFLKTPNPFNVAALDIRSFQSIGDECALNTDKKVKSLKLEQYYKSGAGIMMMDNKKNKEYVYYNSLNDLVSRLELLHRSQQAGSNAHANEISNIEIILRKNKCIK